MCHRNPSIIIGWLRFMCKHKDQGKSSYLKIFAVYWIWLPPCTSDGSLVSTGLSFSIPAFFLICSWCDAIQSCCWQQKNIMRLTSVTGSMVKFPVSRRSRNILGSAYLELKQREEVLGAISQNWHGRIPNLARPGLADRARVDTPWWVTNTRLHGTSHGTLRRVRT
jgi:hypothetical protein